MRQDLERVCAAREGRAPGGGTIEGTVKAMPPKFLPETVVYLESVPGEHSPQTVDMDQKAMKFVPHVLSVSVGDTVRFWNHDTVPHNVFSPEGGYNLGTWPPGEHRDHTFDKPGAFTQLCSLHPDMLGYVYVAPSSFSAVVDSSGHFALRDVPPGTHRIAVWNSHLKAPAQSVVVRSGAAVHASFALHQ